MKILHIILPALLFLFTSWGLAQSTAAPQTPQTATPSAPETAPSAPLESSFDDDDDGDEEDDDDDDEDHDDDDDDDDHDEDDDDDDDDDHNEDDDDDHHEDIPEPTMKEIRAFVNEQFPEAAAHLKKQKQEDPEMYEEIMDHMGDILHEYRFLQQDEAEFADAFLKMEKLEVGLHLKGDAYNEMAEGPAREAARKDFLKHLGSLYDARLDMEKRHLKQMEEEIEAFRRELEDMEEHRAEEIEEMAADWLDEDDDDEDDEDDDDDLD